MASPGDTSPPPDRRGLRRLLLLLREKPPERSPLIPSSSSPPPPPRSLERGKRGSSFASAAFRGLGCSSASSSQAFAPAAAAAVRSSADWQGKRPRRRRAAKQKKKEQRSQAGGVGGGDMWCAPGIPFAADASVDCVVSHHQMVGRGRPDSGRAQRERPCISRRGSSQDQIPSFMGSPSDVEAPYFGSDLLPPGHLRYMRGYHRPSDGLEEIMMFQTRLLFGGMDLYDRYHDWRLDVDNMSYEELLELGDRIGYVSTGLREEDIVRSLRKVKRSVFNTSPVHFTAEIEWKCSICQEEYEVDDEMGRLECGHSYHVYCIKQWLSQKNACPVCKTAVHKT